MPTNEPLRRSMAYVQFLAQLEEIQSLLTQGYSKKLIHERLTEQKLISMAYVTFCQIMQKEIQNSSPAAAKEQKPASTVQTLAPKPPPSSGPRIVNTAKEPFPDPRKMSVEDGI